MRSRRAATAAARSFWSKTALPTTNQSTPASRLLDGFGVNASINLEALGRLQQLFDRDRFRQHVGHEFLSGETGIDAHDEHEIDVLDRGKNRLKGRCGAKRDANAHAEVADLSGGGNRVLHGFDMEGDAVDACLGEIGRVAEGLIDHQVRVEEGGC